jgi:hypothetical protein
MAKQSPRHTPKQPKQPNMGDLLKQAQKMQEQLMEAEW